MTNMQVIADRLKAYRRVRGMSQIEVAMKYADLTGKTISQTQISTWENGSRRIYADQLHTLAKIYNCTPYDLMDDKKHSVDRLHSHIEVLPSRHKETMQYAAVNWPGDTMALIENLRVYMQMPPEYRRRCIEYELYEYEQARIRGELYREAPDPDVEYIRERCDRIGDNE